jgi:hypothetical protein
MSKSRKLATALALILLALGVHFRPAAGQPNDIIWQFPGPGGVVTNHTLAFARVVQDGNGRPLIEADSRNDKGEWHSVLTIPKGLLKAGDEYLITLDYEIVARAGQGNYFYLFIRSQSLGYGADHWQKWGGEAGARGVVKFRVAPSAGDYGIVAGIHNQGAMRIRSLRVVHGSGWTELPVDSTSGAAEPPPAPTGAQPFTIDPPANPNGPVLNLADFGAVADSGSPPSPGPDRNLEAFKAALAKARETKASKLVVPNGVYRFTSGATIEFTGLSDFTFDGGGATFLFHQIKGGAGLSIGKCNRCIFSHFNLDWDWKIDPLASIGRVVAVAPDRSSFEMRFETTAPLDARRWVTMNPLDEKLRVPGAGGQFGGFDLRKIESLNPQTVRVWPGRPMAPKVGQLYLLRHYTYEKHGIVMTSNTHLSLQDVTIFSFPGIGFVVGGDQHHFECLRCRVTFPEHQRRPITTTADGFHVMMSQGYIRLQDCDLGYMGDDAINIHDNFHAGVRRVDDHTLVVARIVPWTSPFAAGDPVEIRNGDFSRTGFSGKLKDAKADYKSHETTLLFDEKLPNPIPSDAMLFNHRYGSRNFVIRNCYLHENRARGIIAKTADGLIEGNRFFHNQFEALHLEADIDPNWSEGFGARNVVVRGNQFDAPNPAGVRDGAAVYVGATVNGTLTHYPLLEGIILENNSFKDVPGPVLEAASFKNLVLNGNRVISLAAPPLAAKARGDIRAELGTGLWVEANEWATGKGMALPRLFYDGDTTTRIILRGNHVRIGATEARP